MNRLRIYISYFLVVLTATLLQPRSAVPATTTMLASGALAPVIVLTAGANLDFGEIAIPAAGTPGYYDLNEATGAATWVNATQVGVTAGRGTFTITGRRSVNVNLSIIPGALACDPAYIGACAGTPVITTTNTFTTTGVGQISALNCPGGSIRCTDTVSVGGRFSFSGTESGRWTSTLSITANYQ